MNVFVAIVAAPTIVILVLLLVAFGKALWLTGGILFAALLVAYYVETRPKPRINTTPDNSYLHIMEIPIIISLAAIPVVLGLRYVIGTARASAAGFGGAFLARLGAWAGASFVFLWVVLPYFLD